MSVKLRLTVVAVCMAALVSGIVGMWWYASQNAPQMTAAAALIEENAGEQDPIRQFRTEREQLRAMQKSQLNDIIHSADTDAETRRLSQRKMLAIMEAEEGETKLEGLLSARGFEDALVTVSENAINVMVRREALNQRETAIILEMVMRETGISGGNVKIIPIY